MGLRGTSLAVGAGLLAVGLLAALPFLNKGLVGTGEAFNYSLSVADSVTQMRHGVLPPLVGQTEYAFNGRVHPLRNAPYLHYLAGAIDLVTFHRLTFWQLQNASLVLSLAGAVFTCYWGLRWGTGCPRGWAFLLASVYGLSSPILCAAHQLDLFMTVHAAVFVPLAIGSCIRGCRQPSFSADASLAASLAATWLAHPPVALWLTVCVVAVRALAFIARPSWSVLTSGILAAVMAGLLSCFVFASVNAISADLGYFSVGDAVWHDFADVIMNTLRNAFPADILPVSRDAGHFGDLQVGYVPLLLLALTLRAVLRRPSAPAATSNSERFVAGIAAAAAVVLLVLVYPVPGVTHWLWRRVPGSVLGLTTEWPMQRLDLLAVAFCVFAAAVILPGRWKDLDLPTWMLSAAAPLGVLWTLYQAQPFITRGYHDHSTVAAAEAAYRPSNLDLTITSYAYFGAPPTFNYGVMDPEFEFRILRDGKDELTSPLAEGIAKAPVVLRGQLRDPGGISFPRTAESKLFKLEPGHRYLLTFAFKTPPVHGSIELFGSLLHRGYALPEAGQPKGFGMLDGERRTIPLWTDSPKPELVEIHMTLYEAAASYADGANLADFTLQDVDMSALPVRLLSLLPMRFEVDSTEPECTVETPRRFLSGYAATVNGVPVFPSMSPYRQLMLPVPQGHSIVELRYVGTPAIHIAFWVCACSWLGFVAWRATGSKDPMPRVSKLGEAALAGIRFCWKHRLASALTLAVLAGTVTWAVRRKAQAAYLGSVGPMRIDFKLPTGMTGVNHPLLATGKPGAGTVIFVTLINGHQVRLGADVWGALYQSAPIEVDGFNRQTVIVSDSALYPLDHPAVQAMDPADRDRLRSELRIEMNGKPAITQRTSAYESTVPEVLVGQTRFGSLAVPRFSGQIVKSERLFIPQMLLVPRGRHAVMKLRLPTDRIGSREPLVAVHYGMEKLTLYAEYLEAGRIQVSTLGPDGALQHSDPFSYDPAKYHVLDIAPVAAPGSRANVELLCLFDGTPVLGNPAMSPVVGNSVMRSGVNDFDVPEVDARFTGPTMDLGLLPSSTVAAPPETYGALHLVLSFPIGKTGRHEPLLTTGRTGKGDFVYVGYEDAEHVSIGFDHWGVGGKLSDKIAVDYSIPHELWIQTAALYPEVDDGQAWGSVDPATRAKLREGTLVILDGKAILSTPLTAYPSAQAFIAVGKNGIGGSTADPEFTGQIEVNERVGAAAPPDQGP